MTFCNLPSASFRRASSLPFVLLALVVAGTSAYAQDDITFTSVDPLTGPGDVTSPGGTAAIGTSFDGLQGLPNGDYGITKTTTTIGDTTFNALADGSSGDGYISLSGVGPGSDGGFTSSAPYTDSPAYDQVLRGVAYTAGTGVAGITLGSAAHPLTVGDEYQLQLFDAAGSNDDAVFTAGGSASANSVTLTGDDYALGTFVATSTTESLSFMATSPSNNAGVLSALDVRDLSAVPEPSTYAMLAGGVAMLVFLVRRKSSTVKA